MPPGRNTVKAVAKNRDEQLVFQSVYCALALFPLAYLAYGFIHAALRRFDSSVMNYAGTDPAIYPYFFLNPERTGAGGMAVWILALLAGFVALGYLFMPADRALCRAGKRAG